MLQSKYTNSNVAEDNEDQLVVKIKKEYDASLV